MQILLQSAQLHVFNNAPLNLFVHADDEGN